VTRATTGAIGASLDRVEGREKVTGAAKYAYEHDLGEVAYAAIVQATIAKGEIRSVDPAAALAVPGVLAVLWYGNAPRLQRVDDGELALFQSNRVAYRGQIIAAVVAAAAFSAANATMLMGSRMIWAFGLDLRLADSLGRWSGRAGSPVNAILVQGAIALALVGLGALSRSGFEAMVAYVAPVFWLFFLLTGISLFVLRRRDPAAPRPFRVPLYPATPILFCAACAYLLWSSLVHAGPGALLGLAVLATGLVPLWLTTRSTASRRPATA